MDEQKKTSGSLALNSTPRVDHHRAQQPHVRDRKLRVAAYARVSSSSEDQLNSFAAQNAHYTELITANPEWEFVDVYADKGITGTSAEKRDDFQRLLAGCRRGRVDKIPGEVLLPVRPERQGVPEGHPGAEDPGGRGTASRDRVSTPLNWPASFSPPSLP